MKKLDCPSFTIPIIIGLSTSQLAPTSPSTILCSNPWSSIRNDLRTRSAPHQNWIEIGTRHQCVMKVMQALMQELTRSLLNTWWRSCYDSTLQFYADREKDGREISKRRHSIDLGATEQRNMRRRNQQQSVRMWMASQIPSR